MKKRNLPILIFLIFLTIACLDFKAIREDLNNELRTAVAEAEYENLTSGATPEPKSEPAATSEPVYQTGSSSVAVTPGNTDGMVEYSVTAVSYGCTCKTDGNVSFAMEFQDDKLIRTHTDGSTKEFIKVSQDRYERTCMGYYILRDKTGGKDVETKVDEERRDVIILTETGFIAEFYHGDDTSPCCYFTYTRVDD